MLPLQKLQALRRELHTHPEVSGQERHTSERIIGYLRGLNPDVLLTDLGGHGIVATFDSGSAGPSILFRSELDALPILEQNTFAHRSSVQGVSHKCGHDGHMAILCGLAEALAAQRPAQGKVHLLFQPAEETGQGAATVLADARFADYFNTIKPDYGVALHNFPGLPKHAIIVRNGIFTAAVSSLIIRLTGRTSHASEPERGINPSLAVADLLRDLNKLNLNDPSKSNFQLVTPVHIRVGSPAYGVSAGDGEVHLTIRSWSSDQREMLQANISAIAEEIASEHRLGIQIESLQTFYANDNDPKITDLVREAATQNHFNLIEMPDPFKGGEDFGLFTSRFPCCMFGLGAGDEVSALHSPDYDFPDELIETGVRMFETIVRNAAR